MRSAFVFVLWTVLLPVAVAGQATPSDPAAPYQIYTAEGHAATLENVAEAMRNVSVVFVGEEHDDPVAHLLEDTLLALAYHRYGTPDGRRSRPVALSLEMFARDAQPVLDEYLGDLIQERHFFESSSAWQNYESDYRALIEFARAHGLPVLAANAPRRYVNRVSRLGPGSLDALTPWAKQWLAPLPYPAASEAYRVKWERRMAEAARAMHGGAPADSTAAPDTSHAAVDAAPAHGGTAYLLDAQALWDATMAYSLAEHLTRIPEALVIHVAGSFHVEEGTGVPEQLEYYRPGTRRLVIAVRPAGDVASFDAASLGILGDFIMLTDADQPRTFTTNE